jgi:hypothetical protein
MDIHAGIVAVSLLMVAAAVFAIRGAIRALQSANGLRTSRIRAGDRLTIPESATPSAPR